MRIPMVPPALLRWLTVRLEQTGRFALPSVVGRSASRRLVGLCKRASAERNRNGERTRPACWFGRPAQTFVPHSHRPAMSAENGLNEIFGGPPKMTREPRVLPRTKSAPSPHSRPVECEASTPLGQISQFLFSTFQSEPPHVGCYFFSHVPLRLNCVLTQPFQNGP